MLHPQHILPHCITVALPCLLTDHSDLRSSHLCHHGQLSKYCTGCGRRLNDSHTAGLTCPLILRRCFCSGRFFDEHSYQIQIFSHLESIPRFLSTYLFIVNPLISLLPNPCPSSPFVAIYELP